MYSMLMYTEACTEIGGGGEGQAEKKKTKSYNLISGIIKMKNEVRRECYFITANAWTLSFYFQPY